MSVEACNFINNFVLMLSAIAALITIFEFIVKLQPSALIKKIRTIASLTNKCFTGYIFFCRKTNESNKKKTQVEDHSLDILQYIVCTMNGISNGSNKKSLQHHLAMIISSHRDEIFTPGQRHPWFPSLFKKNLRVVTSENIYTVG